MTGMSWVSQALMFPALMIRIVLKEQCDGELLSVVSTVKKTLLKFVGEQEIYGITLKRNSHNWVYPRI